MRPAAEKNVQRVATRSLYGLGLRVRVRFHFVAMVKVSKLLGSNFNHRISNRNRALYPPCGDSPNKQNPSGWIAV